MDKIYQLLNTFENFLQTITIWDVFDIAIIALLIYKLLTLVRKTNSMLKSVAEKRRSRLAEWAIKLAAFNAALTLILFAFNLTVFDLSKVSGSYIAAYAILNAVFAAFDYGVSKLIFFYMARIHSHIRRG